MAKAKKKKKKATLKELLTKLEKATDPRSKQKIRTQLRSLGHKGGLNVKKKKKKAAKKKKK